MDDRSSAVARGGLVLTVLGALTLLLALLTVWQSSVNSGLQRKVSENQAKLSQAQAIVTLDNNLVQLLAKTAVESNDAALRDLLAQNGVTLKAGATPPTAAAPSAASERQATGRQATGATSAQ